jgi:hypothetical protein
MPSGHSTPPLQSCPGPGCRRAPGVASARGAPAEEDLVRTSLDRLVWVLVVDGALEELHVEAGLAQDADPHVACEHPFDVTIVNGLQREAVPQEERVVDRTRVVGRVGIPRPLEAPERPRAGGAFADSTLVDSRDRLTGDPSTPHPRP